MWLIMHLAQFLKNLNCRIYFDKVLKIKLIKTCYVTIFILRINMYSKMFQPYEFIRLQLPVADTTVARGCCIDFSGKEQH